MDKPLATDSHETWSHYWATSGQSWRREPEITKDLQRHLASHLLIPPDTYSGIFPFKDVKPRLSRADIEWLLANHASGELSGPAMVEDYQKPKDGLDLRGTNLMNLDLSGLPHDCREHVSSGESGSDSLLP